MNPDEFNDLLKRMQYHIGELDEDYMKLLNTKDESEAMNITILEIVRSNQRVTMKMFSLIFKNLYQDKYLVYNKKVYLGKLLDIHYSCNEYYLVGTSFTVNLSDNEMMLLELDAFDTEDSARIFAELSDKE